MELVHEFFLTALLALVLSFVVAKLVSIALGGDDVGRGLRSQSRRADCNQAVVEELKFDRGLRVEGTRSRKRVQFVEDVVVTEYEEFEGDDYSTDVSEGSANLSGGVEVEQSCREVSEVVRLAEMMSRGGLGIEEVETSVVGGHGSEHVEEEKVETGLENSVLEEESHSIKAGEAKESLDVMIVGESIGNKEAYDRACVEVQPRNDDVVIGQSEKAGASEDVKEEVNDIDGEGSSERNTEKDEPLDINDDDDWEGIERTELEKVFAVAANYVGGGEARDDRLPKLESDVQMQLYGLHKVATEGPCHEPQPMALKVSARSKWNAWQKLGNMSPEMAMEQYICVLSDKVPGWMQDSSSGSSKGDSSRIRMEADPGSDTSTFTHTQPNVEKESEMELKCCADDGDLTEDLKLVNEDKE